VILVAAVKGRARRRSAFNANGWSWFDARKSSKAAWRHAIRQLSSLACEQAPRAPLQQP
jgi:hypothetical protein